MECQMIKEVRIICDSPRWSAKIQRLLNKELRAVWMNSLPIPWNIHRKWIIVRFYEKTNRWCIHWMTEHDFNEPAMANVPCYTAKELYNLRPEG